MNQSPKINIESIYKVLDQCEKKFFSESKFSEGVSKFIVNYYSRMLGAFFETRDELPLSCLMESYEGNDFNTDFFEQIMSARFHSSIERTFLEMYEKSKTDKHYLSLIHI